MSIHYWHQLIQTPESTNLRFMPFMKNLSPFARCYPYSLSTLSNPITEYTRALATLPADHSHTDTFVFQVGIPCIH
jgi:hypothetical protein